LVFRGLDRMVPRCIRRVCSHLVKPVNTTALNTTAVRTLGNWHKFSGAEATLERKEKHTLVSDHNGSLLSGQPGAMTIGHSPEGKERS